MAEASPLNLYLISDSYDHAKPIEAQKGGTTRLLGLAMQEAARQCGGTLTPLGADKEMDAISAIKNDGRSLAGFVRCQSEALAHAFDTVRGQGIKTLVHKADPHTLNFTQNPEDASTQRKVLQTHLDQKADVVIAPTSMLADLARSAGANVHVIPNPADATRFLSPWWEWKDRGDETWQATTSMYSLHAPGTNLLVDGLEILNSGLITPRLALDIQTAIKKKPSEVKTHASADARDHAQELLLRSEALPWLTVSQDFSVAETTMALQAADFYVIPNDPIAVMTPYQNLWRFYRGMDRAAMALAYGLLPFVQNQVGMKPFNMAPALAPLKTMGAIVTFDDVPDLMRKLGKLSGQDVKAKIEVGQKYVRATRRIEAVGKRHLKLYNKVLGR